MASQSFRVVIQWHHLHATLVDRRCERATFHVSDREAENARTAPRPGSRSSLLLEAGSRVSHSLAYVGLTGLRQWQLYLLQPLNVSRC